MQINCVSGFCSLPLLHHAHSQSMKHRKEREKKGIDRGFMMKASFALKAGMYLLWLKHTTYSPKLHYLQPALTEILSMNRIFFIFTSKSIS